MSQNAWQASMRFSLALTQGTHWTRAFFRVTMSLIDQRMVDLSSEPDFRMLRSYSAEWTAVASGHKELECLVDATLYGWYRHRTGPTACPFETPELRLPRSDPSWRCMRSLPCVLASALGLCHVLDIISCMHVPVFTS